MNTIETAIKAAAEKFNECGIFETFVDSKELREYWGLEKSETAIMQRVFVVVAYGEVTNISFERSRAISNLLNEYDVTSLQELPA
jgi:hypothetical protein